jgi:uncharacterized protein (DUF433 family)
MATEVIKDRGRGPEIEGTRITVFTLLPDLLDPQTTEASICQSYNLAPEQVAAARAYILRNPDLVLDRHVEIETGLETARNPPEVVEKTEETRRTLLRFKDWLAERDSARPVGASPESPGAGTESFPTFAEWLAQGGSRPLSRP